MNEVELTRLHELVVDEEININRINASGHTALLLLCLYNKSATLFESLKIFLDRQDLDLQLARNSGHDALVILCQFYPHDGLLNCIRLFFNRGVDIDTNQNNKQSPFLLLCHNFNGKTLIDAIRIFFHQMTIKPTTEQLETATDAVKILRTRCLFRDAEILSKIILNYQEGGYSRINKVSVRIYCFFQCIYFKTS